MTDETPELIELYRRYRAALETLPFDGRYMSYPEEWTRLPRPLHFTWMPYSMMLEDFARELANTVNDLTTSVDRLRAWAKVVPSLSDQQKMNACHEFIDELATVAVGLPYAIRCRFVFATAHLSHQANIARQRSAWVDDLRLDRQIEEKDADVRIPMMSAGHSD